MKYHPLATITLMPALICLMLLVNEQSVAEAVIEEIIVTAQKREQKLQDVPLSVTVLQSADISVRSMENVTDLYAQVPGLEYTPSTHGGSNTNFYIRGIGQVDFISTVEPGVGVYIDGVYVARTVGSSLDLLDIERVEILRGPQGTLFGKNTIGGAINVVTKTPDFEHEGQAVLRVGERHRLDAKFSINVPITDDTLAARFSFTSKQQDGYGTSLFDGEKRSDNNTNVARATLLWRATDNFDVRVSADSTSTREAEKHTIALGVNPNSFLTAAQNEWAVANGVIPFDERYEVGDDIFVNNSGFRPGNDITVWGTHVEMNWDITPDVNLRSITAYRNIDSETGLDFDTSPSEISDQDNIDDQDQLSQELLLSGVAVDNRLDWLLGAFYMDEEGVSDIILRLSFKDAPSGFGSSRHNEYSNQSYAVFAQGTYKLLDRLSVVGGVRYSLDDKEDTVLNVNLKSGIPNLPTTTRDDDWDVVTYRVGLEYKLSDDVLSYVSYATGYKVGGWNGRSSSLNQFDSYAQEEVETIEIGFKGNLLDRKLRLNFSGYYSDYTDIQTTVNFTDPVTGNVFNVVQNAAAADIYGMELEALAYFGEFWQVNLGVSWMDAEYSKLDPGVLLNIDHELPQIPERTLTTGIQYAHPFSSTLIDDGKVFFRADYSFKDDFHHNAQNSNFTLEPSYAILNLRAAFGPSDGRWQLAAYAKNVFDEEYMLFREDVFAFTVAPAIVAPPREVGVEMSFIW